MQMRPVKLEYGSDHWGLDVPEGAIVVSDIPAEQVRPPLPDLVSALRDALAEPMGIDTLGKLIDRNPRVSGSIAYLASKGGVLQLTRGFAVELAP